MKANKRPLILVSNDDGVSAKGLKNLIEVVKPYGDIVVVAPETAKSGMSHAISFKNPIRLNKVEEYDNVKIYSCSGTPADCVKLALNQVVDRKPDYLVSGINHGSNASISVIYSGTMGAAIEGCLNGIQSIGFSILSHSLDADFALAKKYSQQIFEKVMEKGLPKGICLNVNFPVIDIDELEGFKVCRQAQGVWKEEFDKRVDPNNKDYYWLTGNFNNFEPDAEDTDEWALRNNYASIVPIKVDFTSYGTIEEMKEKGFEKSLIKVN
ncbi:MAG: 5'/3'-nucleotidase SurE [Bacteroidetes bacterium]|nr:MAG: 5'/3'-nucleotidase SurE [Bacteroidota bacterium]